MTDTPTTNPIADAIVETVELAQSTLVAGVRQLAEALDGVLPELPGLPFVDQLPDPVAVVTDSIGFADRLAAAQRQFALDLVSAAAPLLSRTAA